jgi:hypothetical protein
MVGKQEVTRFLPVRPRFSRNTQDHAVRPIGCLLARQEEFGQGRLGKLGRPDSRNDPDNFIPGRCRSVLDKIRLNRLAQSIFVRKKRSRKLLIHDHDPLCVRIVAFVKRAPFQQRNSQSFEIAWRDRNPIRHRHVIQIDGSARDAESEPFAVLSRSMCSIPSPAPDSSSQNSR